MIEITNIFDKTKRDLRSKSNDGDDSKRPREYSLDDSIVNATNTNTLIEYLKSEDCVAIIYSCMKKLEEEMKNLSTCVKEQKKLKLNTN